MRQLALFVCLLTAMQLAGCAASGFMASLSDEELPVEPAPLPYPTAVGPTDADLAPKKPEAPTPRITVPPAPATPLAMVPSALRMNRPPAPMPVQMPHQVARTPVAEPVTTQSSDSTTNDGSAVADENLPPIVAAADVRAASSDATPNLPASSLPQPSLIQPQPEHLPATAPLGATSPMQLQAGPQAPSPSTQPVAHVIPSADERLAAIAQQRDVLIAMLEEDVHHRQAANSAVSDQELPRLEQQLRLLYAAADRPDDAARAIDALSEPEREAYKHLMFGLSTWFADHQAHRGPFRAARVLRSLRDASSELAAASKLDLRNLAFCERVESFGWFTEFTRNEFLPKQQVILYVEVDNFTAQEKSPHTFETELQGHYQIFDARGNIVAERKLPLDREVCRNMRRDYFLAYPIYLPDTIEAGRYRLELTIEDLKVSGEYQGRKFGEGTIEFSVRS